VRFEKYFHPVVAVAMSICLVLRLLETTSPWYGSTILRAVTNDGRFKSMGLCVLGGGGGGDGGENFRGE